jgi:hypothetical protein
MMRLKVEKVSEGLHPSEVVVSVNGKDGPISLVLDLSIIFEDGTVNVGWPVATDGKFFLIELPRETMNGSWRIWVPQGELKGEEERKRAMA